MLFRSIVDLQVYSVALISDVQQGESVVRLGLSVPFQILSLTGYHTSLRQLPRVLQEVLLPESQEFQGSS